MCFIIPYGRFHSVLNIYCTSIDAAYVWLLLYLIETAKNLFAVVNLGMEVHCIMSKLIFVGAFHGTTSGTPLSLDNSHAHFLILFEISVSGSQRGIGEIETNCFEGFLASCCSVNTIHIVDIVSEVNLKDT